MNVEDSFVSARLPAFHSPWLPWPRDFQRILYIHIRRHTQVRSSELHFVKTGGLRWGVEVTFQEVRAYLGFRNPPPILRSRYCPHQSHRASTLLAGYFTDFALGQMPLHPHASHPLASQTPSFLFRCHRFIHYWRYSGFYILSPCRESEDLARTPLTPLRCPMLCRVRQINKVELQRHPHGPVSRYTERL